jgi:hypothetical protein
MRKIQTIYKPAQQPHPRTQTYNCLSIGRENRVELTNMSNPSAGSNRNRVRSLPALERLLRPREVRENREVAATLLTCVGLLALVISTGGFDTPEAASLRLTRNFLEQVHNMPAIQLSHGHV